MAWHVECFHRWINGLCLAFGYSFPLGVNPGDYYIVTGRNVKNLIQIPLCKVLAFFDMHLDFFVYFCLYGWDFWKCILTFHKFLIYDNEHACFFWGCRYRFWIGIWVWEWFSQFVFGIHLWDYDLKLVCCEYKFCKMSRCISKKFHPKGKHKTKHKLYKNMYLRGGWTSKWR